MIFWYMIVIWYAGFGKNINIILLHPLCLHWPLHPLCLQKRTKTRILCIKRKLHSAHCTYFFSLLNYECLGNLMVWYIPYNGDIMVIYRGEEWYWYWYDIDRNATQKNDIWSDIISDFSEMIWSDIISEKMWYLTPLAVVPAVVVRAGAG